MNVFVAMWVFLALAIVMLVMVALQTGRKPEDDKIHPVLMDRFPIELLMLRISFCGHYWWFYMEPDLLVSAVTVVIITACCRR